ncbi:MAG: helix-turn-helix domain-containing protein [Kordia sp.]|uniref:helix-turn-helix domain-containing protein n=1 Tax=Kordia sp. TaxID=1965332 RepID=UPI00385C6953
MKKFVLYVYLFFGATSVFAQENDSLLKEFNTLRIQFRDKSIGYDTVKIRSAAYLEKAKKDGQHKIIGRGYYLLAIKNPELDEKIKYLDTVIFYTKNLKNDPRFPTHAYLAKGKALQRKRNYPEALSNYLLAEATAESTKNETYLYDVKYNIAFLKRISGNYKEAEKLFKECARFEERKKTKYIKGYLYTLLQLSSTYYESGQTVKSTDVNIKGIQLALANNLEKMYHAFVVNEGVNLYVKGNYQASIDSIQKGISFLPKDDQLVAGFYLGKSYHATGNKQKAFDYFKKVDTVYNKKKDILFPPLRESYVYLIKDARKTKNKEKQLYYITQLLEIDSSIHADYRYLSENISKNYDIPAYVASKERLIQKLRGQNKRVTQERNWIAIIGGSIGLLAMALLIYYYKMKKKYEKRYHDIIAKSSSTIEEKIIVKNAKSQMVSLDIDELIVTEILKELELFEQGEKYLKAHVSLKEVTKIVNTNSKYLSKIINTYKGKNFTAYINDLRIDYLINHIQHNTKYQKYTIRAISEEIGFSNPESFSRAFQKKTGLKPSYFIRKIRENSQNENL